MEWFERLEGVIYNMELKKIPYELAVCKLKNLKDIDLNEGFYFVGCLVEKNDLGKF